MNSKSVLVMQSAVGGFGAASTSLPAPDPDSSLPASPAPLPPLSPPFGDRPLTSCKTFTIGARLEAMLARQSLTPAELASKAGVSERSVHRHLRDLPASRQVVKYYADAFKTSVEKFLAIEAASHLPAYRAWLRRAAAEVPFWPASRQLRRPALRDVFLDPPLCDGPSNLTVVELVRRRFVVVTGKAGAGKTTLIHALAAGLSAPCDQMIPLLLDVRDLGPDDALEGIGDFLGWLRNRWTKLPILPFIDELPGLLDRHRVMFLVDGLDELDAGDQRPLRRALDLLNFLPRDYPNCQVIATCRDEAFQRIGSRLRSEYSHVAIGALRVGHVAELVQKLSRLAAAPQLGARLAASVELNPDLAALLSTALGTTLLALALLDDADASCTSSDVVDRCLDGLSPAVERAVVGRARHGPGADADDPPPLESWLGGLLTAPEAPDALVQSALARLEDKPPSELFAVVAAALDSCADRPDGALTVAAQRLRQLAAGLRRS